MFIVMADVVGSRSLGGEALAAALREITQQVNRQHRKAIASPLTVTLGDEFQGVVRGLGAAVAILHSLERQRREDATKLAFELRYVVHKGEITSPINPRRAHNMVGPGLTRARELLNTKRRDQPRYTIEVTPPALAASLAEALFTQEAIERRWSTNDYPLIERLLANDDDEAVAREVDRHRTSVARRRQTLQIPAFQALQSLQRRLCLVAPDAWTTC